MRPRSWSSLALLAFLAAPARPARARPMPHRRAAAHKVAHKAPESGSAELARQIADAVQVTGSDVVLVRCGPTTLGLAEAVAAEDAKRGASTGLDYVSPDAVRSLLTTAPQSLLDQANPVELADLQAATVLVDLASAYDPGLEAGVDPVRLAHRRSAKKALFDAFFRTGLRRLTLAGAGWPSEASAKLFHAEPAAFDRALFAASVVKTPLIQDKTSRAAKVLAGLKEIHIVTREGTDLTLRLAGLPLHVDDGVLSADQLAQAGPKEVSLPAGFVAAAPHQFFGAGVLVVPEAFIDGVLVKDLRLRFADGKAEAESGGQNYDVFKKAFALASGSKGIIGVFGVGTNDASKAPPGSTYRSSEMAGIVTVGIGYNKDLGGSNEDTAFRAWFLLADATVTVNGQTLVENGRLILP